MLWGEMIGTNMVSSISIASMIAATMEDLFLQKRLNASFRKVVGLVSSFLSIMRVLDCTSWKESGLNLISLSITSSPPF